MRPRAGAKERPQRRNFVFQSCHHLDRRVFPLLTKLLLEGDITHLPDVVQAGLVRAIHDSGGQARLGTETYRDGSYLVVRMGRITPRTRLFLSNPVARAAIVMDREDTDRVEWYAPWPELSRFAVDEITSAALLEKSVVLLDHNRVALPLDVAR